MHFLRYGAYGEGNIHLHVLPDLKNNARLLILAEGGCGHLQAIPAYRQVGQQVTPVGPADCCLYPSGVSLDRFHLSVGHHCSGGVLNDSVNRCVIYGLC